MASKIFRDNLLAGKRALVTGGGTGIGRAIALELANLGADVAILGRRAEPLEAVGKEITALGRRALTLPCDIRQPEQVAASVGRIQAEFGGIDVLVNNAGGQFVSPTASMSLNGWNSVINTNLNGTFYVTREVADKCMIPQKSGVIVNIVIDMFKGVPAGAHSGAARAAVDNLTKTLSVEWAQHKIRINAIAPGIVRTDGLNMYPPAMVDQMLTVVPLQRAGKPEEIAWMIAYLASEAGDWITGETISIDGGGKNWGSLWSFLTAVGGLPKAAPAP